MSQQINLYAPVFRPAKAYFSSRTLLFAGGTLLAGMIALSGYAQYRVYALGKEAEQVSRLLKARIASLQAAAADKTGETRRKTLESRVKAAEAELNSAQRIADAIESSAGSASGRFSEYLRALARQTVSGVWLTSITVDLQNEGLFLAGAALRPELVSDYLDRLRHEQVFQGRSFARVEIKVAAPPAGEKGAEPAKGAPAQLVEFRLMSTVTEAVEPAK